MPESAQEKYANCRDGDERARLRDGGRMAGFPEFRRIANGNEVSSAIAEIALAWESVLYDVFERQPDRCVAIDGGIQLEWREGPVECEFEAKRGFGADVATFYVERGERNAEIGFGGVVPRADLLRAIIAAVAD